MTTNGVLIVGHSNLESTVSYHASQVLAANYAAWITHFWDADAKALRLDLSDEILKGCLITHEGRVVHPQFVKAENQNPK